MDKLDQIKDLIGKLTTEIKVSENELENKVSEVDLQKALRQESDHIDVILSSRKKEFYATLEVVKIKVADLDKELSNLKLRVTFYALAAGGIGNTIAELISNA